MYYIFIENYILLIIFTTTSTRINDELLLSSGRWRDVFFKGLGAIAMLLGVSFNL